MNTVSYSLSPIEICDIEPEVIIHEEEHSSIFNIRWTLSPSRELNSSSSFEDIQCSRGGDSLDVEEFSATNFLQTKWSQVQQETAIQINGSVVIVPPVIEQELVSKKQSKDVDTENKGNRVITCNNEFHQERNPGVSTLKMKNSGTCSKRYNPSLPCLAFDPKISITRNHQIHQAAKISEVKMVKKRLFSECSKPPQRFVCNFCDRLFKSLECLQSHHETHDSSYWSTPYSWMEEEMLSQESNRNLDTDKISFIVRSENEGSREEGFTCQVCDMVFASVRGLFKHMGVHRISYNKIRSKNDPRESISQEGHALIDLTD